MTGARLIHLNGPPGVGKSTLAERWADEHPGTLNCDIDRLRLLVGGWETWDDAAGLIRTAALAMITTYLRTGHDVVLPQLVAREDQLARFATAAAEGGGGHVHLMLTIDPDTLIRRFRARAAAADDAWTAYATAYADRNGGDDALREWSAVLRAMPAIHVPSTDPDSTYTALLRAVETV